MSSQLNVSIQMQLCTVCMSSLLSVVVYHLHEARGEQTLTYPETTTAVTLGGTKGSRWLLVSLTVGTSNFYSTTGVNRVNNNATHITSHTHTASCTYTKHTHTHQQVVFIHHSTLPSTPFEELAHELITD
jgi:hypothetical protein